MAAVPPRPASKAYHIWGTGARRTQAEKRRLEQERERVRAAEVMEWHARERERVRARNAECPWRLPEARGEVL